MKKIVVSIHIIIFIFLAGCFILECEAGEFESKSYFYDRIGELMLVGKGMDIYVERLDAGTSRRITNTSDIRELDAFFAQGGSIVVYKAEQKKSAFDRTPSYEYNLFMQPTDKNDLRKTRIGYFLYRDLKKERIKQRDRNE